MIQLHKEETDMKECHQLHALTPVQSEFAAQNHELVFQYLRARRLNESEFYSEIILRYLSAVQRYDEYPELRRYSFKSIAFAAMDSAVGHYQEWQRRRPQEVGLHRRTPEGFLLEETIGSEDPGYLEIEQREERERLLSQVSAHEGNLLRLKVLGFTHREAGEQLGCSAPAVQRQLRRMRLRIGSAAPAA